MKTRQALCLAVVMIALYFLTGCDVFRHSQSEQGLVSGVISGQPVVIKWTRDTEGTTKIEIPDALISGALAGVNATPWGALITGGVSVVAAAFAANRQAAATAANVRAEEHKADAAEGWAKATETP